MNDATTARTNSIQTSWISTELFDLVETNGTPDKITTDPTGGVSITIPGETYRIYSTTNALEKVNNP